MQGSAEHARGRCRGSSAYAPAGHRGCARRGNPPRAGRASEGRAGQGASERSSGRRVPPARRQRGPGRQGHPGGPPPHADPPCNFLAPSLQSSRTLLARSLQPSCHFFAPSLPPFRTFLAISLHPLCNLPARSLHTPCYFSALSIQSPCTLTPCTLLAIPCPLLPLRSARGDDPDAGTRSPSPPPAPKWQRPPVPPTYEQPGEPPAPDHGGHSCFLAEPEAGEARSPPVPAELSGARRPAAQPWAAPGPPVPAAAGPRLQPAGGRLSAAGRAPEHSSCSAPSLAKGEEKNICVF